MCKVNMTRYYDLIFGAIVDKITPEERVELDAMKAQLIKEGWRTK